MACTFWPGVGFVKGTAEEPALSEAERVPLSKTVRASL
jgi:hypothetical protein